MAHYIAVKDKHFDDWQHYKVAEPVARYIKQLEHYIVNPGESKLKEIYPERFKEGWLSG